MSNGNGSHALPMEEDDELEVPTNKLPVILLVVALLLLVAYFWQRSGKGQDGD
ncbi:MAG TPA: hypothetical protein VHP83_05695 [Aggregatilineaceae bacterium]|nr:hypothetical protein [Aggregatilineaceae bacterium]